MKLCYFINSASYFILHWLDRARDAQQSGYQIHLLAEFYDGKQQELLERKGIICHPFPLRGASVSPVHLLLTLFKALRLIRQLQPDLVHCITIKPCLIGIWVARRHNTLLSFPGLGRLFSANHPALRILRRALCYGWRKAALRPHCLLTFEHKGDQQILCNQAQLPVEHTRVTGVSGVNPDEFRFTTSPRNFPPRVLFAARLIHAKGLDVLVRICRQLRQEGTELELLVAGLPVHNDPDAIGAEQIQAWSDAGEIVWLGACEQMPALLASADLVALPTRYAEGVPRILLEAAACGRPSVAFDRGGCRTVLHNNQSGILVPDGDERGFADALRTLLNDPDCRDRAGRKGREQVMSKFTAAEASRRMLNCYNELIPSLSVRLVMEK
ncbi:TPA: glycosyltransferase family 4 protein [Enterobacter roggenkampii]|nr:glycosyltransferase family 4 protein [Enterobacter roggenkampii]